MNASFRCALALIALAPGVAAAQSSAEPLAPARLRWKWAVGQELRYRSRSLQKQKVSGPRDMEIEVEQTLTWRHKVTAVDELGIASLETVYEAVKFRMKNPAGEVRFDSAKDRYEDPDLSPFVLYFPALIGKAFTLRVDARGKVRGVAGFDKIRAAMIKNLEKDAMAANQSAALEARYSDKAILDQFQLIYRMGNSQAVKTGDEWQRSHTLAVPGLGTSKVTDSLKVLGAETRDGRPCVKIALRSKTELDASEAPAGWRVSMSSGDESVGGILFDEAAGALRRLESKGSQTLTMKAQPGMSELDNRQTVTTERTVVALPLGEEKKDEGEGTRERDQGKGSR